MNLQGWDKYRLEIYKELEAYIRERNLPYIFAFSRHVFAKQGRFNIELPECLTEQNHNYKKCFWFNKNLNDMLHQLYFFVKDKYKDDLFPNYYTIIIGVTKSELEQFKSIIRSVLFLDMSTYDVRPQEQKDYEQLVLIQLFGVLSKRHVEFLAQKNELVKFKLIRKGLLKHLRLLDRYNTVTIRWALIMVIKSIFSVITGNSIINLKLNSRQSRLYRFYTKNKESRVYKLETFFKPKE